MQNIFSRTQTIIIFFIFHILYTFLLILFLQDVRRPFRCVSATYPCSNTAACFPCATSSARLPTPAQFPRSHGCYSKPSFRYFFREIPACFSMSFWSMLRSSMMVRGGSLAVTVCNVVVRRSRCPMLSNGSCCRFASAAAATPATSLVAAATRMEWKQLFC